MSSDDKSSTIIEAQVLEIYQQQTDERPASDSRLRKFMFSADLLLLGMVLILLPFLFGGVHETSYLSFRMAIFIMLVAIIIFDFKTISQALHFSRNQGRIFSVLMAAASFLLLHAVCFWFKSLDHPVLGSVPSLLLPFSTINILTEFLSFISVFALTIYYLERQSGQSEAGVLKLGRIILISGLLVSLTALSHWFYDNGRLFWTFAPRSDLVSSRARWPFVNSNHLAIFLLLPIFLALGKLAESVSQLKTMLSKLRRRGNLSLPDLFSNISSQKILRAILIYALCVLTFGLAIIASLSRNAIFSCLAALLLFYLFPGVRKHISRRKSHPVTPDGDLLSKDAFELSGQQRKTRSQRRRRQQANSISLDITGFMPAIRILSRFMIVCAVIAVFMFFLGEKGEELFKSRLEYALLYTQDDMRWQLYKDSMPMLYQHPFLGVGLGNWPALYPSYMSEGLSGMDPGFLHSDILQLIIETGIAGFFILGGCLLYIGYILFGLRRKSEESDPVNRFAVRACFFGMLAVILCSAFEFPFRIPAICALFSVVLGLSSYQENHPKT